MEIAAPPRRDGASPDRGVPAAWPESWASERSGLGIVRELAAGRVVVRRKTLAWLGLERVELVERVVEKLRELGGLAEAVEMVGLPRDRRCRCPIAPVRTRTRARARRATASSSMGSGCRNGRRGRRRRYRRGRGVRQPFVLVDRRPARKPPVAHPPDDEEEQDREDGQTELRAVRPGERAADLGDLLLDSVGRPVHVRARSRRGSRQDLVTEKPGMLDGETAAWRGRRGAGRGPPRRARATASSGSSGRRSPRHPSSFLRAFGAVGRLVPRDAAEVLHPLSGIDGEPLGVAVHIQRGGIGDVVDLVGGTPHKRTILRISSWTAGSLRMASGGRRRCRPRVLTYARTAWVAVNGAAGGVLEEGGMNVWQGG